MTITESFDEFLKKIKVDNSEIIATRYKEITKKLNKTFRDTNFETDNCLQVGSYGRYTGIKGISDLDMLYIMPMSKWEEYKDCPGKLLRKVRDVLVERYPTTDIKVDRLVVDVCFGNFTFEVQPVFEVHEGDEVNYRYPDTKCSSYRITKPRQEQEEMRSFKHDHGNAHRHLCKMIRAWKNNVGLAIGGLLIDTLTHRFLSKHSEYNNIGISKYDELCRDFFEYLKDEPKQDHYQALGSGQNVKVKHPFQNQAKKAYKKTVEAIEEEEEGKRNDKWREIFGFQFPKTTKATVRSFDSATYTDPEQFIENFYPIDIRYSLRIDCEISRDGFREIMLSDLLAAGQKIRKVRSLMFSYNTDTPLPYDVKWKARNIGEEALRRHCLRGEIINSNRSGNMRRESADFYGPHYMECFIIKNGVVVARNRIDVPIE